MPLLAVEWNITDVVPFPMTDQPRRSRDYPYLSAWWLGLLADGTQIQPGDYVMRVAALIPFGDPTLSEDWDAWSVPFSIVP